MRLEKWDPRTEGPTPPIVADEAYIKSKLDGKFWKWRSNDWTFEKVDVEPDELPDYRPLQVIYQNQYGVIEEVDDGKIARLFQATLRLYKIRAETMRRRFKYGGKTSSLHPAQKVFVLACTELLNAPLHQIGRWLNRDGVGTYEIKRIASKHRDDFRPRVQQLARALNG